MATVREKTITIDGVDVKCKCSALTYIKYRSVFKEDLMVAMQDMAKNIGEGGTIPEGAFATLFQATYIMATQAGEKRNFEDWMDQFGLVESMTGIQEIYLLLLGDQETIDEAKKKKDQPSAE